MLPLPRAIRPEKSECKQSHQGLDAFRFGQMGIFAVEAMGFETPKKEFNRPPFSSPPFSIVLYRRSAVARDNDNQILTACKPHAAYPQRSAETFKGRTTVLPTFTDKKGHSRRSPRRTQERAMLWKPSRHLQRLHRAPRLAHKRRQHPKSRRPRSEIHYRKLD